MKRVSIIVCCLLVSAITSAAKKKPTGDIKFPLTPVPAKNVTIEDFFWYGQQQEALRSHPDIKATPWKSQQLSTKKIKKLSAAWHKKLQDLDIRGFITQDNKGELQSAIDLAEESAHLALATGDARYADVMSRALYNGICGRQSQNNADGEKASQILAGISEYAFATSGEHLYINMYIRSEAHIKNDQLDFTLLTTTSTPWYYQTILQFTFNKERQHIVFHFRLPEWLKEDTQTTLPNYTCTCKTARSSYAVMLNGRRLKPKEENGYLVVDEILCDSDVIGIQMPAPIMRIVPKDDPTKVILQKGPLVYSFLNLPAGTELAGKDDYHSEFDKHRHTNVLSGTFYKNGQSAGRFTAEPYLFNRLRQKTAIQVPFRP